jgi:hypothetical protein
MHNRVSFFFGIKHVPLFYESYHFSNSIALILLNNAARTSVRNGIHHGTQAAMDFFDSSFFAGTTKPARKTCLPTPSEVLARSKDSQSTPQPTPVKFESLDLLVKFGPHVVVEEALCLNMIHETSRVPVPEVYGWRVDGDCVFIYMQLVRGESLLDRWDSLSGPGKVSICDQLREIVLLLRQIEQDPSDRFIGMYVVLPLTTIY